QVLGAGIERAVATPVREVVVGGLATVLRFGLAARAGDAPVSARHDDVVIGRVVTIVVDASGRPAAVGPTRRDRDKEPDHPGRAHHQASVPRPRAITRPWPLTTLTRRTTLTRGTTLTTT